MVREDQDRVNEGYVLLHEAYNRLVQIREMDNTLAHIVRKLGAIEDTLYEYTASERKAV